jgi:multiple sugar transport system ATP-binding protein
MAEVSIRKLNKMFDVTHVVKDVDLEIRDKEFVVLVGPSGCGKTTTLRMVAGLEAITSGQILIDNSVVNEVPPMDRDIAMVFQNYALYPHMSVAGNMAFGLKMRKFAKPEIESRIKRDPKVFLFDEPLSNLDAKLRVQMRVELKKLHERLGTTAIYVTHDQVEAMTLGDRVVVMKDGWVQQVGEPLELYNTPANRFVAGFIGSPAMNFIEATLGESDGAVVAEAPGLRLTLPGPQAARARAKAGRAITLGIRPEDVHVATDSDPANLCFDAIVEVVEQLGSEILLDTRVGPATVVASVEPTMRIRSNDRLRMSLKPERLHLFDAETEAAI